MKQLLLFLFLIAIGARVHADDRQVLVISGMTSERKIAVGPGVISVLSGGDPEILQTALAQIDPTAIRAVVSFGVAGGLAAQFQSGDVVVATGVVEVETGVSLPTDPNLTSEILSALQGHSLSLSSGLAASAASGQIGITAVEKAAINTQTGALSIDNESVVAAQWAAENQLPFAVLRTIDDPQSFNLPPAVLNAINADGSSNVEAVLESLLQDPDQLPGLVEIALHEHTALKSLQQCRGLVNLGGL